MTQQEEWVSSDQWGFPAAVQTLRKEKTVKSEPWGDLQNSNFSVDQ